MDGVTCPHSDPPHHEEALAEGLEVNGVVVCTHVFGAGVYLESEAAWGHVNLPALRPAEDGRITLPSVGTRLDLRVLGYSGTGQLRLSETSGLGDD